MKIRPACVEDRTAWDPLWKGYQAYYEVDLSATTDNTWDRLMNPKETGPWCLVCEEDDGRLIGFTTYLLHDHTWGAEPRCYLVDLFTKPESRGKRVGRQLIEAVHAEAQKLGCSQTYWLTQHFNEAGRRLYDKVAKETPFIKYQM
ncbi:GNAT family N-acetyltransferase [Curvivirga aplysinae]|uniref:GNAT family N-acetyltransferase n=1 Tax=Curvivirga aplysinae TaxID=2529852 RepID=UPI0012BD6FDC|nr:GNAT family N-acetyltransferase [Curvivirga aplysinae]MTI09395.1 GNAT family N-acetyltransferase [Curvivirga aplysinae]